MAQKVREVQLRLLGSGGIPRRQGIASFLRLQNSSSLKAIVTHVCLPLVLKATAL